jgi:Flp pilus assembly pilin Flp
MLSPAKLGHALQQMPTILDLVRKFRDFLKDESAAAAIEYIALSAGIAVAVFTAIKPANLSPACYTCGRRMRFVRAISKFRRYPELRIYECGQCRETVVDEWRPLEKGSRQMPNSRQGARTLAAALTVLRKEWGIRNFDIAAILGIWAGSVVFGWKQQPYWLIVPLVVCIAYTVSLIGRHSTWAARGLGLARRRIYAMWMSGKTAGRALYTLLKTWWWVRVEERYQKNHDEFPRRDLALDTVCPKKLLLFSADQMNSPLIHWG